MRKARYINANGKLLDLSTPCVMGILNATPDSFYADSRMQTEAQIARRVEQMAQEGAGIMDVGAYSSRPGAADVSAKEEMERLRTALGVVRRLQPDAIVSVDTFRADMARMCVEEYGAAQGMIRSEGETTSYSVVLAIPGIDRIFLHHPGANHTFRAEDIPQKRLEEAALFHFGYPPLMRSMYENNGAELVKLMKRAKECGAATSLDFAAIDPDSQAGEADWKEILKQVIPYVDILVPSVEELCFMLDRERFESWQQRGAGGDITGILDMEKDVKPLADQCMELGAKILLIKCGAPGIYYQTADRETLLKAGQKIELDPGAWADQRGFEKSYVPDQVLSGTGAGDTCIGAFLTALLKGRSLKRSVQLAAAAGASCVAAYDALSGLKSFEELEQRIEAGWKKN